MREGRSREEYQWRHPVGKRAVAELAGQSSASDNSLAPNLAFNTGTLVGPGTGLTVSGTIDGYECNLTVDTGSDISIVHPDILQDQKVKTLQPVTPSFRTVTGQKAQMKGRCNLTVRIGSTEVSQPIWVADIQDPCILGTDFLEPLGCIVNLKDCTLLIGDEEEEVQVASESCLTT